MLAIYNFAMDAIAGADLPEFAQDAGDNLQERIDQGNPNNVVVAFDTTTHDRIIGYIELDPDRDTRKEVTHIRGIYVLPEYRRRGIGRDMLEIIREHVVSQNVQLRIDAFTQAGLKFWENYGFKIHHYALFHDKS
jgi:GNAT superfamily N-acetyltransferase